MKRFLKIAAVLVLGTLVSWGAWSSYQVLSFYRGPSERFLSETGFEISGVTRFSPQTYRFEPQYPFWSDGAEKARFIHIPAGRQIDNSDPDRWNFPQGTRIWKEFKRDGVPVEVRMLLKYGQQPWEWDLSVYFWSEDGRDARKLALGRSDVLGTKHDIPSPSKCVTCHNADDQRRPLGITAVQLPWEHESNLSISQLIEENRLTHPPSAPYLIPGDDLARTALGYLDTNCGSCHYDGSTFVENDVPLRLNLSTQLLETVAETNTYQTAIGKRPLIPGLGTLVYIEPGQPESSFLHKRMTRRDDGGWQMPPLATEVVDEKGAQLIAEWISSLAAPP